MIPMIFITLRLGKKLQLFMFIAQTMCVAIHGPELAGLWVLACGKDWGAFFTTLVGMLTLPVAYEYVGFTPLNPTHQGHYFEEKSNLKLFHKAHTTFSHNCELFQNTKLILFSCE